MSKCEICGEPMPVGEEMFRYHGLSGNCPSPETKEWREMSFKEQSRVIAEHNAKIAVLRKPGHQESTKPPQSSGLKESHMAKKMKPLPFKKSDKKDDKKLSPKKKK